LQCVKEITCYGQYNRYTQVGGKWVGFSDTYFYNRKTGVSTWDAPDGMSNLYEWHMRAGAIKEYFIKKQKQKIECHKADHERCLNAVREAWLPSTYADRQRSADTAKKELISCQEDLVRFEALDVSIFAPEGSWEECHEKDESIIYEKKKQENDRHNAPIIEQTTKAKTEYAQLEELLLSQRDPVERKNTKEQMQILKENLHILYGRMRTAEPPTFYRRNSFG